MKRHTAGECTVEEFDDWAAASDRFDAVGQAADEEGGPSLSLVPLTDRGEVWPTDLLPPAPERGAQRSSAPVAKATRTAGRRVAERTRSTSPDDGPVAKLLAAEAPGTTPVPATPFDGVPWELRKDGAADPQAEARESFPAMLDALSDTPA